METVPLGRSGLRVSQLGMGCVKLGSISGGHGRRRALRLVHEAVDAGIRLFDTADAYSSGLSESILGEALATVREDVVVATKVGYRFDERTRLEQYARGAGGAIVRQGRKVPMLSRRGAVVAEHRGSYAQQDFSPGYVRDAVTRSIRRLRTDHLDLLQFHGPPPADSSDLPEVVRGLLDAGLVRSFGVGCERLEVAASWVGVHGVGSIQLPFGVLDPQAASEVIPSAHRAGIGVIARGVLGGGVLAQLVRGHDTELDALRREQVSRLQALATAHDVDLMQLAVWFGVHRTAVDAVLLGISSSAQLAANVALVGAALPPGSLLAQMVEIVEPVVA